MLIAVNPVVVALMYRHDKAGIVLGLSGTADQPVIEIDDETHALFTLMCKEGQSVADFLYERLLRKSIHLAHHVMKN